MITYNEPSTFPIQMTDMISKVTYVWFWNRLCVMYFSIISIRQIFFMRTNTHESDGALKWLISTFGWKWEYYFGWHQGFHSKTVRLFLDVRILFLIVERWLEANFGYKPPSSGTSLSTHSKNTVVVTAETQVDGVYFPF